MKTFITLCLFLCILLILACLLIGVSYLLTAKNGDYEKTSAYECGFNAFNDARSGYFFNFYIIAILYIIFDLEILFLLPYSLMVHAMHTGKAVIVLFLVFLILGYIYEYCSGSLV